MRRSLHSKCGACILGTLESSFFRIYRDGSTLLLLSHILKKHAGALDQAQLSVAVAAFSKLDFTHPKLTISFHRAIHQLFARVRTLPLSLHLFSSSRSIGVFNLLCQVSRLCVPAYHIPIWLPKRNKLLVQYLIVHAWFSPLFLRLSQYIDFLPSNLSRGARR